jgi:hypothetical protein
MLFWQEKNKCKLSSLPASHSTQLLGHSTPLSCNLTLVGKQFRQTRQRKFFIFGGILACHISCQLPSTWCCSLLESLFMQALYALFTVKSPLFSCFQMILSFWTDLSSGVCRILSAVASSTKPWINPVSHCFTFWCIRSATVICDNSGLRN